MRDMGVRFIIAPRFCSTQVHPHFASWYQECLLMQPLASDRIAVVDVLRAFALFGIVITHVEMGFLAGLPPDPQFDIHNSLDAFVAEAVRVLANGKFFSIFSFLFGLSFAIQLDRARAKGAAFSGRFTWRLAILFAIGFVHGMFFNGDILTIYALLGLLLIPLNMLSSKALAALAIVLVLNTPNIVSGLMRANDPPPTAQQQQAATAARAQLIETSKRHFDIKQNGTLAEVIHMNVTELFISKFPFQVATGRLWITFGFFLLGVCAGRANIFRDSDTNRRFFRRLLIWTSVPALVTTVLVTLYPTTMRLRSPAELVPYSILCVQQVTLSIAYVAAVTLLFWRKPHGSLLSKTAPLGRMGLTTYLMQTVFGVLVFYGFGLGLLGEIGVATCVAVGIAFFVVQLFISRWWMRYFNLGPIEWLWRSLTYFKLQPNGRPQVSPA
jgi:uncharacterized protein